MSPAAALLRTDPRQRPTAGSIVAAARQPGGTLMPRSDRLPPAELADEVLAAAVAFDAWLA